LEISVAHPQQFVSVFFSVSSGKSFFQQKASPFVLGHVAFPSGCAYVVFKQLIRGFGWVFGISVPTTPYVIGARAGSGATFALPETFFGSLRPFSFSFSCWLGYRPADQFPSGAGEVFFPLPVSPVPMTQRTGRGTSEGPLLPALNESAVEEL